MFNSEGPGSSPPPDPIALPLVGEPPQFVDIYSLPASLVSANPWEDTGEILGGVSRARRVSQNGRAGIRKPGDPVDGSLEAFREVVASVIAGWLAVNVPKGELLLHNDRPCFVSFDLGPTALKWGTVMIHDQGKPHKAEATAALRDHCGILALDALVGVMDRVNEGNHVYVPNEKRWYGIDYSYSFNVQARTGTGDPIAFTTSYYPEMLHALREAPAVLETALAKAEAITDEKLGQLFELIPGPFAARADRDQMLAFLAARRANLRQILQEWCRMMKLDGLVKNADR